MVRREIVCSTTIPKQADSKIQLSWNPHEIVECRRLSCGQYRCGKSEKMASHTKKERSSVGISKETTSITSEHNVQTYRFGIFTPILQIVNYEFVRNIYWSISSNGSFCTKHRFNSWSTRNIHMFFLFYFRIHFYHPWYIGKINLFRWGRISEKISHSTDAYNVLRDAAR